MCCYLTPSIRQPSMVTLFTFSGWTGDVGKFARCHGKMSKYYVLRGIYNLHNNNNVIPGQVRYWSLTSLNITQMISDNHCRVYNRLIYVFLFNYFVYYFYDDFTVIFMILFIVWTRFHWRISTKYPQNSRTDKDYY